MKTWVKLSLVLILLQIDLKAQSKSWAKTFVGFIDKFPITIHLHKADKKYSGYYYYDSRQEPIGIFGENTNESQIKLTSTNNDSEKEETFTLNLSNGQLNGTWSIPNKKIPIQTQEQTSLPLTFDYIYTQGNKILSPYKKDTATADFLEASVWAIGNSLQANFVNKLIRAEYDKKSSDEIGKIFLRQKSEFMTNFLGQKINKNDGISTYSVSQDDNLQVIFQSKNLLMLAHFNYSYTGGAHGNYGTNYIPISLISNKIITLNDILDPTAQKQLPNLLEKSYRKSYNLKPTDKLNENGLFDNRIKQNQNFYLTEKGICFVYPPYEIAPYAAGEISLFIPFTEFKGGVKDF